MNIYEALAHMRRLSNENIPFSIGFVSFNESKQLSNGYKKVDKCILRTGLSKAYSDKADVLISYVDLSDDSYKSFNLPLLLEFNQIELE